VTRTLLHSFDPPAASPVAGPTVDLEVSDIEDAGIREVLQTPGAAYGAWSILDALLTPTGAGTPFIFKEPLGQAREVKVALSGLFGRFVARAYLERYFNLSIFAHLGSRIIDLDRRRKIKVKRLSRGDLPDWVACASDLSSLTVAEAKGCHDVGGPAKALDRAWAQAGRIDVTAQDRKVTVKRIAIATRWGMVAAGPADAYLSVRDPVDEGDPIDPKDKDTLFIGLLRLHIANLIKPLGHAELSGALHRLTHQPFARRLQDDLNHARTLLDAAPVRELEKASSTGGLIGGIVTRAGPVVDADVAPADQEALARLHLRPVFVGIERDLIRAAIDAEPQAVRNRIADTVSPDEFARPDRAGGWIIPLGEERRIIGST
jgi:CBS domain-containing protein